MLMPKQELDAEEQFNLALSIVGLVLKDGPISVSDLSEHFGYSEKSIIRAVKTIANSEDIGRFETHFYVDEDLLESGEVDFSQGMSALSTPPVLSKRQTTSLAAGLDFLAALPQFSENPALAEIRKIIGSSTEPITALAGFDEAKKLEPIRDAIMSQSQIVAEYVNQLGERSSRQIDPLRIDFIGRRHYLRGWCHLKQGLRSFRLDRIIHVEVTDKQISTEAAKAKIPEDVFGAITDELTVEISATAEASEIFWNFPAFDIRCQQDGSSLGKIRVGNLQALGRHVTRYGGQVVVVGPPEAKAAVKEFAVRALSGQTEPKDED